MIEVLLPSITTNPNFPWQKKVQEVQELGLTEIVLFPTFIEKDERKELFKALKTSGIKSIPYVHLRHDFSIDEIQYLIDNFGTRKFNIHQEDFNSDAFRAFADMIYVENKRIPFDHSVLDFYSGICFDLAHYYDGLKNPNSERANITNELAKYPVGFCHFSGIDQKGKHTDSDLWDTHFITELSQLDYITEIEPEYVKEVVFELNNSLAEQLEAVKYIKNLVGIKETAGVI